MTATNGAPMNEVPAEASSEAPPADDPRVGMKRADQVTTALLILVCVAYLVYAAQLPQGAGVVPTIVGSATLGIALVQFLATWLPFLRGMRGELVDEDEGDVFRDRRLRRRFVMVLVSLAAIPVLAFLVGLPISLPIYVCAYTLVDRQRWYAVLASSLLVAGLSYGVLIALLGMPLFGGVLGNAL